MKNEKINVEELICIDDLCRILKIKKSYVYLLTHEKKIPHYKLKGHIRFRLSDIEEWLKHQHIDVKNDRNLVDF
jgi:excisionase family DNA binding protein